LFYGIHSGRKNLVGRDFAGMLGQATLEALPPSNANFCVDMNNVDSRGGRFTEVFLIGA
jgi:hypothetical protein